MGILKESQKDKDKVEAGQHSEEKKGDKEKEDVSIVSPYIIFCTGKKNFRVFGLGY